LQGEVAYLWGKNEDFIYQLEKEVGLFNKVRRKVPLSMARERIIKRPWKGGTCQKRVLKFLFKGIYPSKLGGDFSCEKRRSMHVKL
jgi:hypothetical protein